MRTLALPLRWSARDLRAHIAKVLAIALVIAIGTGGYAGLTSTTEWRRDSYDASYLLLAMYDLRVDLPPGAWVDRGDLERVVARLPSAADVAAADERVVVPVQVDASTDATTVLVRGEMIGFDASDGGPEVNGYHIIEGRPLTEADAGKPVALLETTFARFHGLPSTGTITLGGGLDLEYVARASTPEYFTVAPEGEAFMSEATFAGVFTTMETAQAIAGSRDRVNNLVLTLVPGADRDALASELEHELEALAAGASVSSRDDNLSYSALINDIDQDQAMFNILAVLLLVAAIGAAVNLIHRLVQQQRREIGIGMALGVNPGLLAIRPLLVSAEIAILGVAFGVGVGVLLGRAMGAMFEQLIPLPVWDTSFRPGAFAGVAVAGALFPILASAIPVWNAVRVTPVDAIKPSHLIQVGHGGRGRRRHHMSTVASMPFHDLVRARRRTVLTILGLAAAVTVMVGFLGIGDSIYEAVDVAEEEGTGGHTDRITVGFGSFYTMDSPEVDAVATSPSVGHVDPSLRLPVSVAADARDLDLVVEVVDLEAGAWRPTITSGDTQAGSGIILTEKAARDLAVEPGGTIVLRHPRREGLGFAIAQTEVPVVATHPYPVRAVAYMGEDGASIFNLEGVVNGLGVIPAEGASVADVQKELFALKWVSSVQSVTATTQAVRDAFDPLLGVIQVMVAAVLVLALLVAFNTASINLESRAREHATMFAFGIKVRTALRMASTESLVVGVVATAIGFAGGLAMVWWITQRLLTETLPDFALGVAMRPATVGMVIALGVLAVVLAPLFTIRRMRRMDLPGTLRLME